MTRNRTGSLTAATWLIGLGIVFLVQRAADLPWSQAWPMFLILIGVASFVTTILHGRYVYGGLWAFTWPVAWIVIGSILLASTTGRIGTEPGQLIADYWPWAEARVRIGYGAGNLTVGSAAPGELIDGRFEGGVIHRTTGAGAVELTQDRGYGMTWLERPSRWTMGLTTEVPLDLRVDTGASKATLDLGGLRLRHLELHTGASDTRVLLPRAAGATTVTAQTGAASLTIEVPAGVAARIRTRMTLGSSQIDLVRFPESGNGYESPDYATAANRVDIDVNGGVGSFRVIGASGDAA